MSKGQVSPQVSILFFGRLILSLFCMLWLIACSTPTPSQNQEQLIPTTSVGTIKPSQTIDKVGSAPQYEAPLTPTPDCLAAGGTVHEFTFFSNILMADFNYKVYLPPCYESDLEREYPVLYLLHGLSYDDEQWIRLGLREQMDTLIQGDQISPFIVVLPTESRFDPPELSRYSDVLVSELLAQVEKDFRTFNEKGYRRIGGLSRGAAWAVRIGFEHYDLFSKIGAHSLPLFKADVSHVQTWLTQIPKDALPVIFIDIGRDDPEWQTAQTFANQLDQNGVPHEWYLFNMGHSEAYWSDHLTEYLLWYGKDW